jgi:hypothetical protein
MKYQAEVSIVTVGISQRTGKPFKKCFIYLVDQRSGELFKALELPMSEINLDILDALQEHNIIARDE